VDVARDFKPDFVFVDLAMPGMDGYEVARQFRALDDLDGAKIVALSAHTRDEDREKCSGIDGHILKPITAARLKQLLGDCRETTTRLEVQHVH
jgi:CheY-like chemotaxis protein